ncbi:MAG: discoidin domain-containing protein [Planctomycetota bacterium]
MESSALCRIALLAAAVLLAGDRPEVSPWPALDPAVERALGAPRVILRPRSTLESSGVTPGFEPAQAFDGDPRTYWASNSPSWSLPKDLGAEIDPPQAISRIAVRYVVQNGPWAPDPDGVALEIDDGEGFRRVADTIETEGGAAADASVLWTHRFAPVCATAFRLLFTKAPRRPAIAEIALDLPGGMPAAWSDGSPATSVPLAGLAPIEIELPGDRPAAALGLLLASAGFRSFPDFAPGELVVELAPPGAGEWRPARVEWRADARAGGRRSLAIGLGEGLLWTRLPSGTAGRARISGFPARSSLRFAEVLALDSAPLSRAASPVEANLGVPVQPELPPARVTAIAQHAGDLLAAEMLPAGEPSFEALAGIAYSLPGTAALGLPFATEEAGVLWNGTILVPGRTADGRRLPRLFTPLHGDLLLPWGVESAVHRRLMEGPVRVEVEAPLGALEARETAFVAPGAGTDGDLHLRFEIGNRTDAPHELRFAIATVIRARGRAPWEGTEDDVDLAAEVPRHDEATGVLASGGHAIARTRGPFALEANGEESLLVCERSLAPHESIALDLVVPLGDASVEALAAAPDHASAVESAGALWSGILARAAGIELPEPRLGFLYRASLAGLLIAADGDVLPYGAFPGIYDGEVFGVEEAWEMEALASFGFGVEAMKLLRGTYLRPEHLDKRSKHHQYRNGLTPALAWRIYELTRDPALREDSLAVALPLAEWTRARRRESGEGTEAGAPLHAGLLPEHFYGGDLEEPCHALYGNLACWRGLRDTALLLAEAGRAGESAALLAEAAAYRERILEVCAAIAKRDADPPFLPFRLEEERDTPSSGEYYQLFGPLVLETGCLPREGALQRLVIEAIEKGPRLVARQARFGAPLGLDAHYTRGLMAEWLRAGRRADFLLGFYAQQAFAMDRDVASAPEVTPIFFTAAQRREEELRRLTGAYGSDPCAAGPATFLLYLRDMLVLEERDADDLPTGRLILGAGVPAAWLRPGARIAAGPIATAHGPIRFSLAVAADGRGRLRIEGDAARRPRELVLRFPGRAERTVPTASAHVEIEL